MLEKDSPIATWMQKRHLKSVAAIEEVNHAWEGWSEKDFVRNLRDKNIIGMVGTIADVVGSYVIYELREKEIFILKFETAKELISTRVGHVLLATIKRKAKKYRKEVMFLTPEHRDDIHKYQFFAKNGFSSRLKRNFFVDSLNFEDEKTKIYKDGYEFRWNYTENEELETEKEGVSE